MRTVGCVQVGRSLAQRPSPATSALHFAVAVSTLASMTAVWRTIRSYLWWTHPRGSFHYDIMVTLILLFIFLTPIWVNFNDKPTERTPHQTGVVVSPDGQGLVFQVDAAAISGRDDASIRAGLLRVIEPIAGEVEILRFEPIKDHSGRVTAYKVWVMR